MSNNTNSLNGWIAKLVFAAILALAAFPAQAAAQTADRGLWMATSADEAVLAGSGFGRLTLVNGVLAYESGSFEWHLALSDIKRVAASKKLSNAIEIESVTGQVYFVGILDAKLIMASPGKAVQMLQRAVRSTPPPAALPARTTMVAAGSDPGAR